MDPLRDLRRDDDGDVGAGEEQGERQGQRPPRAHQSVSSTARTAALPSTFGGGSRAAGGDGEAPVERVWGRGGRELAGILDRRGGTRSQRGWQRCGSGAGTGGWW